MATSHHFLVIKAGKLGKVLRLGDHQAWDAGERGFADQPEVLADQLLEQLARAAGEALRQRFSLRDDGNDRLTNQRLEQRFLAVEVQVDRALGDAGATGDVLELGGRKPAVRKDLERGADDLLR